MTNLIAQLSLSLVIVTNWTGWNHAGREAGIVFTNTVATVDYQGMTNSLTLTSTPSDWAVWRTNAQPSFYYATNYWLPGINITNLMWDTKNAKP